MLLEAGQRIDRFVLIEPLGEGGQGAVWKARDPLAPDAPCALKLVPVGLGRASDLERVRREARALAQLDHPSLVRSTGLFEDLKHGVLGISMELVQGTSLRQLSRDGRLSPEQKSAVLEHVACALDYLHRSGVVHRDVKLDNVLVRESFWDDPSRSDAVKVVDLGIAAVAGSNRDLTQEGTVVGTLPYLAPELLDPATFEGDQSSPRIDVFAFGVMAWLLLSGRHPSGLPASSTAVDYTRAYRARAVPGESFPDGSVDEPWQSVLSRCLAIDPSQRLPDGAAVLGAIAGRAPESVVVRPSRDAAVASPRAMFDATAPVAHAAADAATVELAKPKPRPAEAKTSFVVPVLILCGAAGIGAYFALRAGDDAPRASASASAKPTASARAPLASAVPDAAAAAPEAAAEAAAPEAALEAAAAPVDPCASGCSSGRGCGAEGCDAPLDPSEVYAVRLGRADAANGSSLLATYQTAEVCVSVAGSSKAPVCMPLSETLDAGVTKKHLDVSYTELVKSGLHVSVQNTLPQGSAPLAHKNDVKPSDGATRELLCKGLVIEGFTSELDVSVERVVLYLDDPEAQPTRCP